MRISEAVNFLSQALEVPKAELRAVKDKVRKRLIHAIGTGKLRAGPPPDLDIDRNDLIIWARSKWPGKFQDFKTLQNAEAGDGLALSASLNTVHLPASLDACHAKITELEKQVKILTLERMMLTAENSRLRPLADRYERIREKNKQSAEKPRKAHWSGQ